MEGLKKALKNVLKMTKWIIEKNIGATELEILGESTLVMESYYCNEK